MKERKKMPSKSQRQKPKTKNSKRITITDHSTGWSHVTTSKSTYSSKTTTTNNKSNTNLTKSRDSNNNNNFQLKKEKEENDEQAQIQEQQQEQEISLSLGPSEPPKDLTLNKLISQFQSFHDNWNTSKSWIVLRDALQKYQYQYQHQYQQPITIISLGLGSPSGFLRDGLVDRRNVSMYQLAALSSIVDFYSEPSSSSSSTAAATATLNDTNDTNKKITNSNVKVYAQDPVFSSLDKSLLNSLGINTVEHPAIFDLVSNCRYQYQKTHHGHQPQQEENENEKKNNHLNNKDGSKDEDKNHTNKYDHPPPIFLYCPGAERIHIKHLISISYNPTFLFGNSLDDDDLHHPSSSSSPSQQDILTSFLLHTTNSTHIPTFEPCEHAFWNTRLYTTTPTYS